MSWTHERVRKLKRLWKLGLSCADIARKLGGVSRSAVAGKADRLMLTREAHPPHSTYRPRRTQYRADDPGRNFPRGNAA